MESEVAAVRALSTPTHKVIVVTTGMISTRSFVGSFGMDYCPA